MQHKRISFFFLSFFKTMYEIILMSLFKLCNLIFSPTRDTLVPLRGLCPSNARRSLAQRDGISAAFRLNPLKSTLAVILNMINID